MRIPLSRRIALFTGVPLALAGLMLATSLMPRSQVKAESNYENEGGGEGQSFPPNSGNIVQKECSACHMAYPAGFLPARSWEAIMAGLKDHFGENATLDEATAKSITDFLTANAADADGRYSRVLRGLGPDDVPLRISETPWWKRRHEGEVRPSAFNDPRVGSKANCVACHRDADQGYYEDD